MLALTLVFIGSRIILKLLGLENAIDHVQTGFLDVNLTLKYPWQSLYYSHVKPPLPSMISLFLNWAFGPLYILAHSALLKITTLTIMLLTFQVLKVVCVSRGVALFGAIFVLIHPAFMMFENNANYFFYDYLVACLLLLSVWLLSRLYDQWSIQRLCVFLFSLFVLCMMRSIFHLVWLLASVGYLMLMMPQKKKMILKCAIPFVAFIVLFYAKNYMIAKSFGPSSWMGRSLYRLTSNFVPIDVRETLVEEKKVSPYVLMTYSDAKKVYPQKSSGHEVLDAMGDSELLKIYLADSLYMLKHFPVVYIKSVVTAWSLFLLPPSRTLMLEPLPGGLGVYNDMFCLFRNFYSLDTKRLPSAGVASDAAKGSLRYYYDIYFQGRLIDLLVLMAIVLCFVSMCVKILLGRMVFSRKTITLFFLMFNILFIGFIFCSLETGENNRFKIVIEPMLTIIIIYGVHYFFQKKSLFALKKSINGD